MRDMQRATRWAGSLVLTMCVLSAPDIAAAQDRKLVPVGREAGGRRVALVIGNDSYPEMPLRNARNDMSALSAALKDVGFLVTQVADADRKALARAIDEFVQAVRPGDTALFYYSGHGIQLEGQNYLVPVDFAAKDAIDAQYDGYAVDRLVGRLSAAGVDLAMVILDACRNNPFRGVRASGGGWAAMQAGRGVYLAFATAPGTVASDNPSGANGLFTTHLLSALREPGLTLHEVFDQVMRAVQAASGGRQQPWVQSSAAAAGSFRFRPSSDRLATPPAPSATVTVVPEPEVVAWQAVAGTNNVAALEQFVAAFPNSQYAAAARIKIAAMRDPTAAPQPVAPTGATRRASTSDVSARAQAADDRGDYVEAFRYYRQAAEAGDTAAMTRVGWMYSSGRGVPEDQGQAMAWYRKAADKHEATGMYNVGVMYALGRSVPRDDGQAVSWYRKGAEAGSDNAMHALGFMYQDGLGVRQDDRQALAWYRKASDAGNRDAMFSLARMYEDGRGVPQDGNQAVYWYRKAADAGNASALANLGWMYKDGRGVPQDDVQAVAWYRKGADAGSANAMNALGLMYENGRGVPKDDAEAVRWYRKGADAGEASAMNNLGVMYRTGRGVPQDDVQAAAWYRKAIAAGNAAAMNNFAAMYENGRGVPIDLDEALGWYRKAAAAGSAGAMNNLGRMYERGRGVPADLEQAVAWYRKAAAAGDEKARENLKRLGR